LPRSSAAEELANAMHIWNKLSLRHNLMLLSMLTSSLAVVFICSGFLLYDLRQFRDRKADELRATVESMGANSDAALIFEDSAAADQLLKSLRAHPWVSAAGLYRSDGRLLVSYRKDTARKEPEPPTQPREGVVWTRDSLRVSRPVLRDGKVMGTLYLETGLEDVRARTTHFAWTAAVMGGVCLLIVYLLSLLLGPLITRPIYDLAWIARLVASGKNYSHRVPVSGGQELRQLGVDFNHMLEEIQTRDAAVREAKDALEARVAERTRELEEVIQHRRRAEHQLRERTAMLNSLIEVTPLALVVESSDARIQLANPAFHRLFGYGCEEVVNRPLAELIASGDLAGQAADTLRQLNEHKAVHKIAQRRRKDGHLVDVEIHAVPLLADGKLQGNLAIYQDIRDRVQAEKALREAKEAAEAANRAKSEFLANMSHEIRTPMNGILGMTELALETELAPEQREYLNMARSSAEALLIVINDILDFSKIEAGKIELEEIPFSLHECVEGAIQPLTVRAAEKGIAIGWDIAADVPDELTGDPTRLRQVLLNLAGNGVKFTKDGEVIIRAEVAGECPESAAVKFTVADTGIGIPREKQLRMFEAFSQADTSTTREYGGTGLGLSISTRLAGLMGGKIEVESEPGRGSRFFFTLQFHRVCELPGKAGAATREQLLTGKRVLAVDSSPLNRRMLKQLFERWKMPASFASSAAEALRIFREALREQHPFNLCLLNQRLSDRNAIDLAEEIWKLAGNRSPAFIKLFSAFIPATLDRPAPFGTFHWVLEPLRMRPLLEVFADALGVSGRRKHAEAEGKQSPSAATRNILLAEDNLVNQKLVVCILESMGHRVTVANNGLEAVEKTAAGQFDLVIMDLQMPLMCGLEATKVIRHRERTTGIHLPIIAATAHALRGDAERCLAAGMDGYAAKPIRKNELEAEMNRLLKDSFPESAAPLRRETILAEEELLARVDGDRALIGELAEIFRDDYPKHIRTLRSAVERDDGASVRQTGHTLKGMLANLAAPHARDLAAQIEELGKKGDIPPAGAILDELLLELRRVDAALEILCPAVQSENPPR
jgi:two-component system sensor histidine kinase/response regulator